MFYWSGLPLHKHLVLIVKLFHRSLYVCKAFYFSYSFLDWNLYAYLLDHKLKPNYSYRTNSILYSFIGWLYCHINISHLLFSLWLSTTTSPGCCQENGMHKIIYYLYCDESRVVGWPTGKVEWFPEGVFCLAGFSGRWQNGSVWHD